MEMFAKLDCIGYTPSVPPPPMEIDKASQDRLCLDGRRLPPSVNFDSQGILNLCAVPFVLSHFIFNGNRHRLMSQTTCRVGG